MIYSGAAEICDAYDNDCDEVINTAGCIWLEPVCDIDYGTFSGGAGTQYRTFDMANGSGCMVAVHDYYNNPGGYTVDILADDMIGANGATNRLPAEKQALLYSS